MLCRYGSFGFQEKRLPAGGVDPCGCYRLTSKVSSPQTKPRKQVFRIDDMGNEPGIWISALLPHQIRNIGLLFVRTASIGGFEKQSEASSLTGCFLPESSKRSVWRP